MIKGNGVVLRALEPQDLDLLYVWENDPATWRVSGIVAPFSHYTLMRYIESAHQDIFTVGQLRMMIESNESGDAIGTVELFELDAVNRRVGIGVMLYSENDRGRGYAKEAVQLILNHADKSLGMHQVWCNITSDNVASIGLFESLGFVLVGVKREWLFVDGKWCDELLYQKLF